VAVLIRVLASDASSGPMTPRGMPFTGRVINERYGHEWAVHTSNEDGFEEENEGNGFD
jgi:hypothetical protein